MADAENQSKVDLEKQASALGLDTSGTKEDLAARINSVQASGGVVLVPESVDAAAEQYQKDLAWKLEHPNEPLIRGSNSEVGGEG